MFHTWYSYLVFFIRSGIIRDVLTGPSFDIHLRLDFNHCVLKVIYHPLYMLYGMNNYVLIWGDWLSEGHMIANHPI